MKHGTEWWVVTIVTIFLVSGLAACLGLIGAFAVGIVLR